MLYILISFFLVSYPVSTESSRIIGIPHLDHVSHNLVFLKVARELMTRGHEYTHVLPNNYSTKLPLDGIHTITYNTDITSKEHDKNLSGTLMNIRYPFDLYAGYQISRFLGNLYREMYSKVLEDKEFISALRELKPQLFLCDTLFQACVILSDMLQVPRVDFTTSGIIDPFISDLYGIPQSFLYLTPPLFPRGNRFSIFNRLKVTLALALYHVLIRPHSDMNPVWKKHVGDNTNFVNYEELQRTVGILLVSDDFAIEEPRPLNPNVKFIGAVLAKPGKPLPEFFERFMAETENGVVLVSLGTLWYPFSSDFIQNLADGLARIPYKVLWKHTCQPPERIGQNTQIVSWMPQNDLLAHSATKLFITHGGANGVLESVYHKVPMIVIPLVVDQYIHAGVIELREIGLVLERFTMKSDDIVETVNKIMGNEKYQKNIENISKLMTDRPRTPTEEGADWIQYALRHNGALHLYNPGTAAPLYQQCMLDILFFIFGFVVLVSYFLFEVVKNLMKVMQFKKEKTE